MAGLTTLVSSWVPIEVAPFLFCSGKSNAEIGPNVDRWRIVVADDDFIMAIAAVRYYNNTPIR